MTAHPSGQNQHHHHLEKARTQVIELLSRQAVERDLVLRAGSRKQDVVASLVLRQQQTALEQRLAQFHPADVAFVLEGLPPEAQRIAWSLVRPERRGAVLLETSDVVRRTLVAGLPAEDIAQVVRPLDSEDIADLLASLPDDVRLKVLERLDQAEQTEVRSVLAFPPGTVGAEMAFDFITVQEDASLETVQQLLRRRKPLPPHTTQLFVVNRPGELCGLLPLQKLVTEEPDALVKDMMTTDPVFFFTDDRLEQAVQSFERYNLISAPVVNLHRQVVGRVTVDSVVETINAQAQRQRLEEVGLSEDTDLYAPLRTSARARWQWLGINLFTAFIASRVIGAFEDTVVQLVALAALMPVVASIGGNAGNQTVALVIRGLALGQLGPNQLRQMFSKELAIAAYNGALWGAVLGTVTLLIYRNLALSVVVAAAMLLNLLVAASVGMLAPVLLQRLGRDPIRGSSIILTAATDGMGFFIFLGLAALFLV
ncbi:MAG: magnesium transporter [Nevskiales bacterium]|nr:magnesium transporter [Nevskiales bacterium]